MTESYWQERGLRKRGTGRKKADSRGHWDIAVIGGGLAGTATAYFLRQFGCDRVVVLEKNFIGYGASGRNAGFILAGLSEPYSRLVVAMGADSAREIMSFTLENHRLISSAVEDNRIDCDYAKCGSYHLATSEVERKELEESVNLLADHGFEVEYRDDIPGRHRSNEDYYLGGFFNPQDGKIDPFAFVNGLADDLNVIEGFGCRGISKLDGSVGIIGENETIKAEMAVLAVNGYAPLLDKTFDNLIFPVRGQMLATDPVGDILGESTYYSNFGYDYFRQPDDDSIIMGGLRNRFFKDEVGYEDITNPELQSGLEDYIRDHFGMDRFTVRKRWGGVMGNTIDGLPLVGALPHNSSVLAMVGFNGHGFGMGMAVARDLAAAIMNNENSDMLRRFSLKRLIK